MANDRAYFQIARERQQSTSTAGRFLAQTDFRHHRPRDAPTLVRDAGGEVMLLCP